MSKQGDVYRRIHTQQETKIEHLEAEVERLAAVERALMLLIFTRTQLCPYGSGRNGLRNACERGSPGCMCDDWVAENRAALAGAEQTDSEPSDSTATAALDPLSCYNHTGGPIKPAPTPAEPSAEDCAMCRGVGKLLFPNGQSNRCPACKGSGVYIRAAMEADKP